jgi:hypothetical protein
LQPLLQFRGLDWLWLLGLAHGAILR